ncbi:MAG: hypothetical protein WC490_04025 [Candidatus Margulisiibacteriota bacterium]
MKRIVLAIAVVVALSSVVSAEILLTASPLGAGKMGWLAAGRYDTNIGANVTQISGGGFLGYGVMDKLDVFAKVGYGTQSGLPVGLSSSSGIMMGLAARYQFLAENKKDMPVSVAGVLGYQSSTVTSNITGLGSFQTVQGDIGVGAIVSKVIVPWVPYGALVYHSLNQGAGVTGSNVEIAVGSQMALSTSSAIIGEVALNSITIGGASVSDTQISLGYTAKL